MQHLDILQQVEQFATQELRPYAKEFELNESLPRELIGQMAERGYLTPGLPEEYGGLGLDPLQYGEMIELIGKACNSVRELITVQNSLVAETLLRFGSREQRAHWLPRIARGKTIAAFALSEPAIGSDARHVQTTYRRDGDHYILNGTKKWISFAEIADLLLVFARQEQGEMVSAFLVERSSEGVAVERMDGLLASKASHIGEIHLQDVAVARENLVGPSGGGFTYVASYALDHGRYSIAWGGVALSQAVLEAMVSYAHSRTQFGRKLGELDLIQAMIGDTFAKVQAIRALCQHAGTLRASRDSDSLIMTTMAKYLSAQTAMEVATRGVQLHGGNGFSNQYPVERYFREAKLLEIIEGTTQVLSLLLGQHALREYMSTLTYTQTRA